MRKQDLNRMLHWLSQVLTCPVCEGHYSSDRTKVVENQAESKVGERSVIIHTDCDNCHTSMMFNVSLLGHEIFSVGMVSDLTSADAVKFRGSHPICTDELIEFHSYLENFDGNFEKVLR